MTEFERGIMRALEIYQAGVRGELVPSHKLVARADAQALYTEGYMDAANEIDKIEEILPSIARFLSRYKLAEH